MRKHIDWQEVNRIIERNQRIIDSGWVPTPEEKMKALRERTAALARPVVGEEDSEGVLETVAFTLATECYGVDCRYVREVFPLGDYTPVPCTPAFVLGVINLRGQIISVIDIKRLLELPQADIYETRKIIVLHSSAMEFAIAVDEIVGIRKIELKALQTDLPTLTGVGGDYFQGITSIEGEPNIIMLDATRLLSDSKLIIHEEVAG
ncbi:MAG: purine-binding chemotaxis protein CheW [Nitrospirae bacterium]|nr:purine-binding chemotaxis protein CheW [Nitrospirota bacterium]